ncbi:hypothetical protein CAUPRSCDRAFT_11302 [Caulochytrium protostelioides]|uniref:Uncharacterized protein n=1 Tax=Caulochytrium protostelioides TaxID=1555241 RepID=A0A4P9X046_9FUNG|nr:hypothetical protein CAUPRSCDRAFT_11302 [Caulochytrium protostelioides]
MAYPVFATTPLAQGLPVQITAGRIDGNRLWLGTQTGDLLGYDQRSLPSSDAAHAPGLDGPDPGAEHGAESSEAAQDDAPVLVHTHSRLVPGPIAGIFPFPQAGALVLHSETTLHVIRLSDFTRDKALASDVVLVAPWTPAAPPCTHPGWAPPSPRLACITRHHRLLVLDLKPTISATSNTTAAAAAAATADAPHDAVAASLSRTPTHRMTWTTDMPLPTKQMPHRLTWMDAQTLALSSGSLGHRRLTVHRIDLHRWAADARAESAAAVMWQTTQRLETLTSSFTASKALDAAAAAAGLFGYAPSPTKVEQPVLLTPLTLAVGAGHAAAPTTVHELASSAQTLDLGLQYGLPTSAPLVKLLITHGTTSLLVDAKGQPSPMRGLADLDAGGDALSQADPGDALDHARGVAPTTFTWPEAPSAVAFWHPVYAVALLPPPPPKPPSGSAGPPTNNNSGKAASRSRTGTASGPAPEATVAVMSLRSGQIVQRFPIEASYGHVVAWEASTPSAMLLPANALADDAAAPHLSTRDASSPHSSHLHQNAPELELLHVIASRGVARLWHLAFDDQMDELLHAHRFDDARGLVRDMPFDRIEAYQANIFRITLLEAHWQITEAPGPGNGWQRGLVMSQQSRVPVAKTLSWFRPYFATIRLFERPLAAMLSAAAVALGLDQGWTLDDGASSDGARSDTESGAHVHEDDDDDHDHEDNDNDNEEGTLRPDSIKATPYTNCEGQSMHIRSIETPHDADVAYATLLDYLAHETAVAHRLVQQRRQQLTASMHGPDGVRPDDMHPHSGIQDDNVLQQLETLVQLLETLQVEVLARSRPNALPAFLMTACHIHVDVVLSILDHLIPVTAPQPSPEEEDIEDPVDRLTLRIAVLERGHRPLDALRELTAAVAQHATGPSPRTRQRLAIRLCEALQHVDAAAHPPTFAAAVLGVLRHCGPQAAVQALVARSSPLTASQMRALLAVDEIRATFPMFCFALAVQMRKVVRQAQAPRSPPRHDGDASDSGDAAMDALCAQTVLDLLLSASEDVHPSASEDHGASMPARAAFLAAHRADLESALLAMLTTSATLPDADLLEQLPPLDARPPLDGLSKDAAQQAMADRSERLLLPIRARLLQRLGRHEDVVATYAIEMNDLLAAEAYCLRYRQTQQQQICSWTRIPQPPKPPCSGS